VSIFENSWVTRLDVAQNAGADNLAHTSQGTVRARHLLVAGGAMLGPLVPSLANKLMDIGTYVAATEPLGEERARALITNKEVIAVDQRSHDNHPLEHLPTGFEQVRVWVASGKAGERYLAVFNLDDKPLSLQATWQQLGLASGKHAARELWSGHRLQSSGRLPIRLPAHGCVLYSVE